MPITREAETIASVSFQDTCLGAPNTQDFLNHKQCSMQEAVQSIKLSSTIYLLFLKFVCDVLFVSSKQTCIQEYYD